MKRLRIAPDNYSEPSSPATQSRSPPLPPADLANGKISIKLISQTQNQRKWGLMIFIFQALITKMMPNTQSVNIRLSKGPFCEHVLHILDMSPPKPRLRNGPR